jgi:uncharacterized membrane protein YphA (DoxX/SURF4 family)
MIDPLAGRAISVALALLLLFAAWHKLSARDRFVTALGEYRLLPRTLWRPLSLLLPAIETVLGVAWLVGFETRTVALLTAALLGVYALAMAVNLWRGRVHIGCGCGFGGASGADQPLSWGLVARNLLLGGAALVAAGPPTGRHLGAYDWLTLAFALAAAVLLYSGASQLMRNGAAIASWRTPRD